MPIDLVTASGSGLDPDITPAAALYQVPRVASERHMSQEAMRSQVESTSSRASLVCWANPGSTCWS